MEALAGQLEDRRARLGISKADLARISGVSLPTVQRLLAGKEKRPGLGTVAKIAAALGVEVRLSYRIHVHPTFGVDEFREMQARKKARRLVRLVKGTMALEDESVGEEALAAMEDENVHRLLSGAPRRLWSP